MKISKSILFGILILVCPSYGQKVIKVISSTGHLWIDTDFGIGKRQDVIPIYRQRGKKEITVGEVRILRFEDGQTEAKILTEFRSYEIKIGDYAKDQFKASVEKIPKWMEKSAQAKKDAKSEIEELASDEETGTEFDSSGLNPNPLLTETADTPVQPLILDQILEPVPTGETGQYQEAPSGESEELPLHKEISVEPESTPNLDKILSQIDRTFPAEPDEVKEEIPEEVNHEMVIKSQIDNMLFDSTSVEDIPVKPVPLEVMDESDRPLQIDPTRHVQTGIVPPAKSVGEELTESIQSPEESAPEVQPEKQNKQIPYSIHPEDTATVYPAATAPMDTAVSDTLQDYISKILKQVTGEKK